MKTAATLLLFGWQAVVMFQIWNLNARLKRVEDDVIGNDGMTDTERFDSLTAWRNTYAARPTAEEIAALKQRAEEQQ